MMPFGRLMVVRSCRHPQRCLSYPGCHAIPSSVPRPITISLPMAISIIMLPAVSLLSVPVIVLFVMPSMLMLVPASAIMASILPQQISVFTLMSASANMACVFSGCIFSFSSVMPVGPNNIGLPKTCMRMEVRWAQYSMLRG